MIAEAERLIQTSLAGRSALALPLALLGGLVVSLMPCNLVMYPAAAATCCVAAESPEGDSRPRLVLGNAVAFVFGVIVATTALGVTAAMLGHTVRSIAGSWVRYAVAPVPILMGLYAFGWIRLPLGRSPEIRKTGSVSGTFFTGFALSLVFAPCGSPVLAAILSYAAYQGRLLYGALLMLLYGVGIGIPILLIGTGASRLSRRFAGAASQGWINRAAGIVLLALGFYLLWTA